MSMAIAANCCYMYLLAASFRKLVILLKIDYVHPPHNPITPRMASSEENNRNMLYYNITDGLVVGIVWDLGFAESILVSALRWCVRATYSATGTAT